MHVDVIVVGGGIAGLTAAAYVARSEHSVAVFEKQPTLGGYVGSFEKEGFSYDQGIRSIESSGIVFPMMKELGLELEFVKSIVSLGIGTQMIYVDGPESIERYEAMLCDAFASDRDDVGRIMGEIRKIMGYMDILYAIDNPLFLDIKSDPKYLLKTFLPWFAKYVRIMPKLSKLNDPVVEYLRKFTSNEQLIDIISQHFFKNTPTFFALSYFGLYLDYNYPMGGMKTVVRAMERYITEHGGTFFAEHAIEHIDVQSHTVIDRHGLSHTYGKLIWAADAKKLYDTVNYDGITNHTLRNNLVQRRTFLVDKHGSDSIYSLFLAVDIPVEYFASKCSAHCFYTPDTQGISSITGDIAAKIASCSVDVPVEEGKRQLLRWLEQYFSHTTYEISFPAMRDPKLAPPGKTGMIISMLFDYAIAKYAADTQWYAEFKEFCDTTILGVLQRALFPSLSEHIIDRFSASPVSMERITGNLEGAITGWAFTNKPFPAVNNLKHIMKATDTPIPGVYQAGQWTFGPAGLPISVMTGRMAADKVIKALK